LFKESSLNENQNAHFILQAISESKKYENQKKMEQLDKIKKELIQNQNEHLSIPRLLFQLKKQKFQKEETFLNFLDSTFFLKTLKLKENKFKLYSNLLKDLKKFEFSNYLIEECLTLESLTF
jgi:hypothetical protein